MINLHIHSGDTLPDQLSRSLCRRSHGVLLVYSVTNLASFNSVPLWFRGAKKHCPETCRFMLIGTNHIYSQRKREVTTEMGQELADKLGLLFAEVPTGPTGWGVRLSLKTHLEDKVHEVVNVLLEDIERFGCAPRPSYVPSQETLVCKGLTRPSAWPKTC